MLPRALASSTWGGVTLFVHFSECEPGKQPKEGDILTFEYEPRKNNPEQYQAKNVKGCSADRIAWGSTFNGPVEGTGTCTGRCKSFGAKGYGFIVMDDGTELFFNVKDCVGSKPAAGDILKFDMADSQMKPGSKEAKNVTGGSQPLDMQMKGGWGMWGDGWGGKGGYGPWQGDWGWDGGKGGKGQGMWGGMKGGMGGYGGYGEALLLAQAVEVQVAVTPRLRLYVLEASRKGQETLIEQAVAHGAAAGCEHQKQGLLDPYGSALWPSALVLAQAVAAHVKLKPQQRILELGAGCGLASLLAARLGGDVLATDFRQLPLQLLRAAARRQALRIRTAQLDISELSVPLPPAELVVASDVLYEKGTADGMAHRVAEAVRRGSAVLVADVGRPNRKAFMTQLRDLLPEVEIGSDFTTEGMAIQETDGPPSPSREVPVQLLELPMNGPASQTVRAAARSIRPNKVGASSLVESTCWEVGVESLST
ncbi:unnamed protein product [Durusdinium trenchii]|uniref:CSD domain-containing protein n=1 Tax=Durusdinium trenchii TaxID=1381693 RepID=A0ABP0QRV6_9DINO